MLFLPIALALIPLAASANPVLAPAPLHYGLHCFRYDGSLDSRNSLNAWIIDKDVTKEVCKTLSSGNYDPAENHEYCLVEDYDVEWFKKRCEDRLSSGEIPHASSWYAGTDMKAVIDKNHYIS